MSRTAIAPAAAIVAALAAGCGSGTPSKTATGSASASPSAGNGAQAAYKYSACMRQHGVSGFPDPVVHQSGNSVSVGIRVDPTLTSQPAFKSAQNACAGLLPAGGSPAQQAAQQHYHEVHLLAFANCMRQHGITSFPDPNSQGRIALNTVAAAGVNIHLPNVIAAARACVPTSGGILTQAAITQATGSGSSGG